MLFRSPRPKSSNDPRPRKLTDKHVQTVFSRISPTTPHGMVSIPWPFVRWDRLHNGALGAIFADPMSGRHYRWVVDFKTGTPRNLGPVNNKTPLLPKPFRF